MVAVFLNLSNNSTETHYLFSSSEDQMNTFQVMGSQKWTVLWMKGWEVFSETEEHSLVLE